MHGWEASDWIDNKKKKKQFCTFDTSPYRIFRSSDLSAPLMNINNGWCPKSCGGQLIFIHCLYLVYNTCLFVKTALYVVHSIKCVHLPFFLRSTYLYFSLRLWCRLEWSLLKESFVTCCMCCMMLIREKPVGLLMCLEARCIVVPSHSALYIGSRSCSTTLSLCVYIQCVCVRTCPGLQHLQFKSVRAFFVCVCVYMYYIYIHTGVLFHA